MAKAKIAPDYEHLRTPLSKIKPDPDNPRYHPEDQIQELCRSLQENGFDQPIIAFEDGIISVGEGRYLACIALGWDDAAVLFKPGNAVERRRRALADNRTHDMSGDDPSRLLAALEEADARGKGSVPGFTHDFVAALLLEVKQTTLKEEKEGADEDEDDDDDEGDDEEGGEGGAKKDTRFSSIGQDRQKQVKAVLYVVDVATVEKALRATGLQNRGDALVTVCKHFLENKHGDGSGTEGQLDQGAQDLLASLSVVTHSEEVRH